MANGIIVDEGVGIISPTPVTQIARKAVFCTSEQFERVGNNWEALVGIGHGDWTDAPKNTTVDTGFFTDLLEETMGRVQLHKMGSCDWDRSELMAKDDFPQHTIMRVIPCNGGYVVGKLQWKQVLDTLSTFNFPDGGIECYYHTASVGNALDIIGFNHLFGSLPSKVNDRGDCRIKLTGLEKSPRFASIPNEKEKYRIKEEINKSLANKFIMDRVFRFVCLAEASKVDTDPCSEQWFWDEYANHFKGVRFKFQIDRDFLVHPCPNEAFCEKISYTGRTATVDCSRLVRSEDVLSQVNKEQFLRDLCYSKSTKWEKEYELRLGSPYRRLKLEMSRITSKEERFFVFNPVKLKEVVVGYAATDHDVEMLKQSTDSHGIPLRKAMIDLRYVDL